jgi:hypothetical protein
MAQVSTTTAPVITYTRGEKIITSKDGVHTALIGGLLIGGHLFDAMEARGRPWLRPGSYRCKMETSSKNVLYEVMIGGKKRLEKEPRQQIRPLAHGVMTGRASQKQAAILIHPASKPEDLTGCIAPGVLDGNYLRRSFFSMKALLELCGGYADGKEVILVVENDMQ